MKLLGCVSLVVVFSLITNQFAFADDKLNANGKPDALSAASSSREAMLESMADPIANKAFHDMQLAFLQTPTDAMVYNYFNNNSLTKPLYDFLVKNNDALLVGFEMEAKSGMLQAVRGLTPKYDLIDKLVVEVATGLGFTKEAITNRQIYILGGDENAFTVSGSQNKIVVAFQRGILRTMTRSEIAGVLAHELGHIRAEHTVKGIMNSIMLEMIGELFVNGKITVAPQDANVSRLSDIECFGCGYNHIKHITDRAEKTGAMPSLDLFSYSQPQNIKLDTKNAKLGFIDQQIQEFVMKFATLPKKELQGTIKSYLQMMIQIGQAEYAPVESINYFMSLLHNVSHVGHFRVNIQEYLLHAKMMEFAISRAKETTADQVSASTVRNEHLASAFAKLIGLDFDKEYRPQIFDQIKKQAQEILTTVPSHQLSNYMGSTHPSLILRINNMLSFPAYPSVLFANNFLRLLHLNDALIVAEANKKATLDSVEMRLKKNIAQIEAKIAEEKTPAPELLELKVSAEANLARVVEKLNKEIAEIQLSQRNHEERVFNLLLSSDFRVDAVRSPRMDNTIQYLSIQREMFYLAADNIQKNIKTYTEYAPSSPAEASNIEAQVQYLRSSYNGILKTLNLQKDFIERLKARLATAQTSLDGTRNLSKRLVLLERILTADSSEALEKVRARVTGVNPLLRAEEQYRRNKVPQKINSEIIPAPIQTLACSKLFSAK